MRNRGECLCVDNFASLWNRWKFLDLPGGSVYAWTTWFKQGLLGITSDGHVSV